MADVEPGIPEEVSNQLLTAFNNDAALKDALATGDPAKIDDAIGALWVGSSAANMDQAYAVDAWEKARPRRQWAA